MKVTVAIILFFSFFCAFGQVSKEKINDLQIETDISSLWIKEIENQTFLNKLDVNSTQLKTIDISSILVTNNNSKSEVSRHFTTFTGILGQNFERVDFHFYSAIKKKNQDYDLKILMKKGVSIDTLSGNLKLIEAFSIPDLFSDKSMQAMAFLYEFNFTSEKSDRGFTIKGTSSVCFYVKDKVVENFWMEDGSFREYIRTFVGYYIDNKTNQKLNCVFALDVAGLYSYLPFCEDFYYIDEENYHPDYYLIKEKYRQYGWEDYDYKNINDDECWKKGKLNEKK